MKRSIILVISMLFILSNTSFAMASDNLQFTFASIQYGVKKLEQDWPDSYQANYGFAFNLPFADTGDVPSVFTFALDIMTTQEDEEELQIDKYSISELHLGLRHIVSISILNIYWGGGLALVYADSDTVDPNVKINGFDLGAGYWVNAGFDFILGDGVSLGLFVRYSDVEMDYWGVNAGGYNYGFSIGIPAG